MDRRLLEDVEIISDPKTPRTFANEIFNIEEISRDSLAYKFFSSLFDSLQQFNPAIQQPGEVFNTYFHDSFSSNHLLRAIIPTILRTEGEKITRESFCHFFLSQKSLVKLLEVMSRLKDTVSLYINELINNYSTLSSVERFKARMFVQEYAKQLTGMLDDVNKFMNSLDAPLDPVDIAIKNLRNKSLEELQTVSRLSIPRKVEEVQSMHADDGISAEHLVVTRKLVGHKRETSEMHLVVNEYTFSSVISLGCLSSDAILEAENATIVQVWTNMDSLKRHLGSPEFIEFMKRCEKLKRSEDISIKRVTPV